MLCHVHGGIAVMFTRRVFFLVLLGSISVFAQETINKRQHQREDR
jgi:hypothetical protein